MTARIGRSSGRQMRESRSVLARFDRPTAERRTRLAVLSDLHLSVTDHGTWRVSHRAEERLAATVQSLNEQDLDGVLFDGDLVQSGARAEFDAFDRLIEGLDVPFFAVPGNHDLVRRPSAPRLTLPEFERRYAPDAFPYRTRVGGVDLIGLNSNASTPQSLADSYEGRLSADTLSWLGGALDDADCPLVAVHHTLDGAHECYRRGQRHLPVENGGSPDFENAGELADVLEAHDAPLVVTGHLHVPLVARFGGVYEFTLPSLGPFPCGYTVFDVDADGTTATFHPVADFEARLEALGYGLDNDRVLLAASQLASLPLVDDATDPT